LAEYCHLTANTTIVRLPPAVPDVVAASANCATATSLASIDAAGGCRDRNVLIQGAGLLGLTAAALAATQGAASVIVTDVDPGRLSWARRFGAMAAIDVGQSPRALVTAVDEITRGRGVDVALEMSGSTSAFEATLPRVRVGGSCVLVGAVRPSQPASIDVDSLVRRMLTLRGVHNYAPRHLVAAVDFLAEHGAAFPFEQLVGGEYSLNQVDDAFRQSAAGGAIRGVVRITS
jgi:alcohol dehydrogenase